MGRSFATEPDAALLAFGSSLEDDLVLAGSTYADRARTPQPAAAGIIDAEAAARLDAALAPSR